MIMFTVLLSSCIYKEGALGGAKSEDIQNSTIPMETETEEHLIINASKTDLFLQDQHALFQGDRRMKSDILEQFPDAVDRTDLANPYIAVLLERGTGFLFYDENGDIVQCYLFDGSFDPAQISIGMTSYSDILEMDGHLFPTVFSSVLFSGHITEDGVYLIRYDSFHLVEAVEFIQNKDLKQVPLKKYGITIPFILPEDKKYVSPDNQA